MQDHASIQEILLAFEQLTPAEKKALRDFSKPRLDNTVYTEPDDLIHEALSRCLNGQRHWPKDVAFILFFCNVIKSIASTERRTSGKFLTIDNEAGGWDDLAHYGAVHPSAEESYLAQMDRQALVDKWEQLQTTLQDDEEALAVFRSQLEGLRASAIRERHQLTLSAYDVSRRRLQRKIERFGLT